MYRIAKAERFSFQPRNHSARFTSLSHYTAPYEQPSAFIDRSNSSPIHAMWRFHKRGRIETVLVIDEDKEEIACNLAVFDVAPTLVDDHDIFVVAVGEYNRQVGDIAVTAADYSTYSGSSFATVNNVGLRYQTPGGLVVYWVTRGTATIAVD